MFYIFLWWPLEVRQQKVTFLIDCNIKISSFKTTDRTAAVHSKSFNCRIFSYFFLVILENRRRKGHCIAHHTRKQRHKKSSKV